MNRYFSSISRSTLWCVFLYFLVVLFLPAASAKETTLPLGSTILFWTPEQQLEGYKSIDKTFPVREIKASTKPLVLHSKPMDTGGLSYRVGSEDFSLGDYIERQKLVGLLVVHKGNIVLEKYSYGNDENSPWISFSIAKSVTSMLLGAAIADGFITSTDDLVTDYLPRLKGSAYAGTKIKDVLQMASGVGWNEDYSDPESDVAKAADLNAMDLFDYLNKLPVAARPGEVFNYNTGETNLVGAIVRAAVGNNLATYLERKIWQPFGMESDASWVIDPRYGAELGGCCINATLRDYARIGLFSMADGVLADGTRILPEGWMLASTTPSAANEGYGYLWWLSPEGVYAARGIFGQLIWINPETETIIVAHSAWPEAVGKESGIHRQAFIEALHAAVNN